mgnify:CR=1 FL=1
MAEYTREDAIEQGRKDAKANAKAEARTEGDATTRQDAVEAGHDAAEVNHKAEQKINDELDNDRDIKNDTSKAAKIRTSKSQLDPTGNDPISTAEVTRAAVDGANVEGGTSVSDEEAVERAHQDFDATPTTTVEEQNRAAEVQSVNSNEQTQGEAVDTAVEEAEKKN